MSYDDLKMRAAWRELGDLSKALAPRSSTDPLHAPRPRILALDVDGSLLKNTGSEEFGQPVSGLIKKLYQAQQDGIKIVIWTVRADTPELRAHLERHKVPYDFINRHPWQPPGNSPKILADWYYDDRALVATGNASDLDNLLEKKPWWKES